MAYYYSPTAMRTSVINESQRRFATVNSKTIVDVLSERVPTKYPPLSATFDIFLSYRSEDIDVVAGVYEDLCRRGYGVYLDRIMDPQLDRNKVTRETADVLRNRLIQAKTLFYVATDNAAQSTWMPWELGFEDGYRGKSAIVPVSDKGPTEFLGAEFTAIYPRAVPITSTLLSIIEPDTTFIAEFGKWRDSPPLRACGIPKCPLNT